ncbi:hypothetical protein Pan241w_26100 [Gimesia alba]|uniref:Uncharacterized protein n=1 Tax=Gimesia alba TaxID=2527973 RepID=A0A517RFB1_9PLAN|nr:hypothetical protein [Gimesia alba]QDT42525.1 hypothetical protein Pan241w_26100 [Gimesia alba]
MEINFNLSQSGIFLDLLLSSISNLPGYHLSDNAEWFISKCVQTKQDRIILNEFGRASSDFKWGELEHIFHNSHSIQEVKLKLKNIDSAELRNLAWITTKQFWNSFQDEYALIQHCLKKKIETLTSLKKQKMFKNCLSLIKKSYCQGKKISTLNISVTPNFGLNISSGTAFMNEKPLIVLRATNFPKMSTKLNKTDLGVLFHEISHLLLDSAFNPARKVVDETLSFQKASASERNEVSEMLVRGGFPCGILAMESGLIKRPIQNPTSQLNNHTNQLIKRIRDRKIVFCLSDPRITLEALSILREM